MAFIDGTVVNVALPAIEADLAASVALIAWIVNAYTLCLAALVLIGGALGDRFGRRGTFVIGIAIFAAAARIKKLFVVVGKAVGNEEQAQLAAGLARRLRRGRATAG